MALKRIKKILEDNENFLITAHIKPEGDSLGSQLAFYSLLKRMGKKAFVLNQDKPSRQYSFLPFIKKVTTDLNKIQDYDVIVVLDCPIIERTGKVSRVLNRQKTLINIDHHISNTYYGDNNWVDNDASSCGEMVYELFRAMRQPIKKQEALLLYVAILTDTGSFGYENTSAHTHLVANELIAKGLKPVDIRNRIYESKSFSEMGLLQKALSTLKITEGGKIAYLCVSKNMLEESGCDPEVTDGFINYARSIGGVRVALLFLEDPGEKNKIQISLRGKGEVNVNELASHFNGGGHKNAAGCVVEGNLHQAVDKVLRAVKTRV